MTAVYLVRMKIMEDNIVGLSVMTKHPTCHNTRFNPGHQAFNVANLNIGLSYRINVLLVNIVQIALQRVKFATDLQTRLEVRVLSRVAELLAQSHRVSVQVIPLEEGSIAGCRVNP